MTFYGDSVTMVCLNHLDADLGPLWSPQTHYRHPRRTDMPERLENIFESFRLFEEKATKLKFSEEQIRQELKQQGIPEDKYDIGQLVDGVAVELEHGTKLDDNGDTNLTNDELWPTMKIAIAHLKEIPTYYTHLARMERQAKQ